MEKNLLEWFWDLEKTREREADAEQYLDSFANAVSSTATSLKIDLCRAGAVLKKCRHRLDSNSACKEPHNEKLEEEREWAMYFVQLLKEAKMCYVFDQLSHGNDRMKVRIFP